jgi:hypothetical protein
VQQEETDFASDCTFTQQGYTLILKLEAAPLHRSYPAIIRIHVDMKPEMAPSIKIPHLNTNREVRNGSTLQRYLTLTMIFGSITNPDIALLHKRYLPAPISATVKLGA